MAEAIPAGSLVVEVGARTQELEQGLQRAQGRVDDFARHLEQSASGLQAFNQEASAAATLQAELGLELGMVQSQLRALAQAYTEVTDPRLQRQIIGETAALQQQERALKENILALRQAEMAQRGVTYSTGLANNVALEFSRGLGDLRYGFHSVANNVEQMIGQFAVLSRQAGGTRAALAAVGSSLLGPIGLVAGFTALTAAGPAVASFFADTERRATNAATQIERIRDAVRGILEINTTGLSRFNVSVDDLKVAAVGAFSEIQRLKREIAAFDIFSGTIEEFNALNAKLAEAQGAYAAFMAEITSRRGTGLAADILRGLGHEEISEKLEGLPRIIAELNQGLAGLRGQFQAGLIRPVAYIEERINRLRGAIESAFNVTGGRLTPEIADLIARLREAERLRPFEKLPGRAVTAQQALLDLHKPLRDTIGLLEGDRGRNWELRGLLHIPGQIRVINREATEMGRAVQEGARIAADAVDELSRAFGDATLALFGFGDGLSDAEIALARMDFEDQAERLREMWEEGQISAERYRAELAVLQQRQREFEASLNPLTRAFETFADGVERTMARVVAAIVEAIAKALIFQLLMSQFKTGTFVGNIVHAAGMASGFGGRAASPAVSASAFQAAAGRPAIPPPALRGGDTQAIVSELRRLDRNMERVFTAVGGQIAQSVGDPHAARRIVRTASSYERLTNPRGGTL